MYVYIYIYIYVCVRYFFQKQSLDTVNLVGHSRPAGLVTGEPSTAATSIASAWQRSCSGHKGQRGGLYHGSTWQSSKSLGKDGKRL